MAEVNTPALEYAPALSRDGLELFFTRWLVIPGSQPDILRSVRTNAGQPFGTPHVLTALTGFVETPALSPDGRSLYFHSGLGGRHRIYRAQRCAA